MTRRITKKKWGKKNKKWEKKKKTKKRRNTFWGGMDPPGSPPGSPTKKSKIKTSPPSGSRSIFSPEVRSSISDSPFSPEYQLGSSSGSQSLFSPESDSTYSPGGTSIGPLTQQSIDESLEREDPRLDIANTIRRAEEIVEMIDTFLGSIHVEKRFQKVKNDMITYLLIDGVCFLRSTVVITSIIEKSMELLEERMKHYRSDFLLDPSYSKHMLFFERTDCVLNGFSFAYFIQSYVMANSFLQRKTLWAKKEDASAGHGKIHNYSAVLSMHAEESELSFKDDSDEPTVVEGHYKVAYIPQSILYIRENIAGKIEEKIEEFLTKYPEGATKKSMKKQELIDNINTAKVERDFHPEKTVVFRELSHDLIFPIPEAVVDAAPRDGAAAVGRISLFDDNFFDE